MSYLQIRNTILTIEHITTIRHVKTEAPGYDGEAWIFVLLNGERISVPRSDVEELSKREKEAAGTLFTAALNLEIHNAD